MTSVYHMTYLQAIVIGLVQGLTELFPVSSLGHTVLVPAWLGGTWGVLVRQESSAESPYLAFIVGLHLATAVVLTGYYWRTWVRIVRGLVTSILRRRIDNADQRLGWLLVIATVPVGIAGLALEHTFRVLFARPDAAALFLTINGGILFLAERYRRRGPGSAAVAGARATTSWGSGSPHLGAHPDGQPARPGRSPVLAAEAAGPGQPGPAPLPGPAEPGTVPQETLPQETVLPETVPPETVPPETVLAGTGGSGLRDREADLAAVDRRLAAVGPLPALWIGAAQILALFAGISREGVTMAGGLVRGLNHEDAMRFSFLLSTPVILAAGALKVPDLTGSLGNGIHGQVVAGSIAAAATSLFAVVFLARYFKTRTLTPFAIYCLAAGLISIIRFAF
ncbi:MAG TPA: undecaprenyl-diphosphate phosphatase [Streptosporangiaceae bacterium]